MPFKRKVYYNFKEHKSFKQMENKPYLPQGLVESVYSLNQSNNNLFRAYDIDTYNDYIRVSEITKEWTLL